MWFLLNPPGKATIQIQSIDNFNWLSTKYNATLKKENSHDPRYTSALNHLRFYLPDVFPALNKVLLFDHDVVVQSDLGRLWNIDMKGKVIGAVDTCKESEASFRRMDLFINFSDPLIAKKFDVKACTWAFGMNLFDLQEWRKRKLTAVYHKYLQLVCEYLRFCLNLHFLALLIASLCYLLEQYLLIASLCYLLEQYVLVYHNILNDYLQVSCDINSPIRFFFLI